MAAIWKELLSLDQIGRNESFFDLGGHSLLAVKLINRVNRECRVSIPLGAVFQTPTIAELAGIVDADWRHREPSVIQLDRGGKGTPLFCVCGIHLYAELAHQLGKDRPVYGVFVPIEAELFNGQAQHISVEGLAAEYVRAIRRTQPKGPYCLTGVSFGGVLAYEIARQLRARGDDVPFLALLDSLLPRALSVNPKRWLRARVDRIVAGGPRSLAEQVLQASNRLRDAFAERLRPGFDLIHAAPEDDELRVSRNRIYNRATARYDRGQHLYDGPVILVRAQDTDEIEGYSVDPSFGWNELVRDGVRIHEIPGGHLDILAEPYVKTLAEKMRLHLERIEIGQRVT
jgi:thioesterase domain-containing protein